MERDNKKRGREQQVEEDDKKYLFGKTSKKQHHDENFNFQVEAQDESESECSNVLLSDDKYLALGVFDFPWLREDEGMISKSSEEWNFPDAFSSSLDDISTQSELFSRQCLYEIPDNRFQENEWPFNFKGEGEELEIGNVDCIWSSMTNQPIQQGVPND